MKYRVLVISGKLAHVYMFMCVNRGTSEVYASRFWKGVEVIKVIEFIM